MDDIDVIPLTRNIGAELVGVDLRTPLSEAQFGVVHEALMAHQVIFLRDQYITSEQHLAFGKRFGELHVHPLAPSINDIPELMRIHTDKDSYRNNGSDWHTDVSCDVEPPMGSILHLHTLPKTGGDTLFSSMYAAYDALSEQMKRILDPMVAVHGSEHVYSHNYGGKGVLRRNEYPSAEHPVIRTHPVTGKRGIYVNRTFTTHIKDLSRRESDALLGFLYTHVENPTFHCRFQWTENAIAFWDNRCVQHFAVWDYFPDTRSGARVTVAGDAPFH
ncbi:MAG: taurine dioxygenase [Gammaproteobacteria bacterium]|jgi:taurine dioxygenase